jgi:HSP20 family protein
MELARWRPFGLDRFHWRINDLFDESLGRSRGNATSTRRVWSPAVDVLESADSYLVRAELPAINKEDFNLQVKEGVLTLSGEQKLEPPASGSNIAMLSALPGSSQGHLFAANRQAG